MSFANFRRRFRTGATKTTTDFLRDTDDSPKSTGRSASEGRGKGLGWRSGRGSPSPAALRTATSPRYAPLRGARCMAAARPGASAVRGLDCRRSLARGHARVGVAEGGCGFLRLEGRALHRSQDDQRRRARAPPGFSLQTTLVYPCKSGVCIHDYMDVFAQTTEIAG